MWAKVLSVDCKLLFEGFGLLSADFVQTVVDHRQYLSCRVGTLNWV